MLKLKHMRNAHRGFTIVELLIVIVVIGVLAAITVVAYNGIQTRAKNASIESAASMYKKALTAYKNEKGVYPVTSNTCIGAVGDYINGCYSATASTNMETGLKTILTNLPSPDPNCITLSGQCRRSYTFINSSTWKVNDQLHPYYMIYFLYGSTTCGLPGHLEGGWGNFTSTRSNGYYQRDNDGTMCISQLQA